MGGDDMKEAAGEANMTVITIVLIGLVAALGAILIPRLLDTLNAKSCCMENGGTYEKDRCNWNGKTYTRKQVLAWDECK